MNKERNKSKVFNIIGVIFLLLASVGLFVTGCLIHRYYEGRGTIWYIAAFVLLIIGIIVSHNSSVRVWGYIFLFIYVFLVLVVPYHVAPRISSFEPICTSHGHNCSQAPWVLVDNHVFCSPIDSDSCHIFACISHDMVIHRHDRCIHCGREYDDHYPEPIPLEKWISKVAWWRTSVEIDWAL